jgi:hypothetical protein
MAIVNREWRDALNNLQSCLCACKKDVDGPAIVVSMNSWLALVSKKDKYSRENIANQIPY